MIVSRFPTLRTGLASLAMSVLFVSSVGAAVPNQLHYQGYLTDASGVPVDCPDVMACDGLQYDVTFRLYDVAEGGTALGDFPFSTRPASWASALENN